MPNKPFDNAQDAFDFGRHFAGSVHATLEATLEPVLLELKHSEEWRRRKLSDDDAHQILAMLLFAHFSLNLETVLASAIFYPHTRAVLLLGSAPAISGLEDSGRSALQHVDNEAREVGLGAGRRQELRKAAKDFLKAADRLAPHLEALQHALDAQNDADESMEA